MIQVWGLTLEHWGVESYCFHIIVMHPHSAQGDNSVQKPKTVDGVSGKIEELSFVVYWINKPNFHSISDSWIIIILFAIPTDFYVLFCPKSRIKVCLSL